MSAKAVALPETSVSAVPYMSVRDAAAAIEFYKKAFGAIEILRLNGPGPKVGHAQLRIGGAVIMLADEFPEYGAVSPERLGGSPVRIHLNVPDVDALVRQATEAGATVTRPVADQFYGERSGQITDPFGYTWILSTHKEAMSAEEMQRRLDAIMSEPAPETESTASLTRKYIPEGFRTLQPYMIASDGEALLEFAKQAFGAEETFRAMGSAGGIHANVRFGDTMLMMGGGIPGRPSNVKPSPVALHVYVEDTDTVYEKALAAGAVSLGAPRDHEYGERGAAVKDPSGNFWYIATHKGESYIPKGLHNVNVYMHPLRAEPVIAFVKRAFGAEEIAKYASPEGVVRHAEIRVGDAVLEMGEANGPYQPMPSTFYLYVPDVDATYRKALSAGAKSIQEPADQPYGDRNAGVADVFGNTWYIATHIRNLES